MTRWHLTEKGSRSLNFRHYSFNLQYLTPTSVATNGLSQYLLKIPFPSRLSVGNSRPKGYNGFWFWRRQPTFVPDKTQIMVISTDVPRIMEGNFGIRELIIQAICDESSVLGLRFEPKLSLLYSYEHHYNKASRHTITTRKPDTTEDEQGLFVNPSHRWTRTTERTSSFGTHWIWLTRFGWLLKKTKPMAHADGGNLQEWNPSGIKVNKTQV